EQSDSVPKEEKPKTKIGPVVDRKDLEIRWPHVLRVDHKLRYFLDIDWDNAVKLVLSPDDAPSVVEVAPMIDNKPNYSLMKALDLDRLAEENRLQQIKLQSEVQLHEK